MEADNSQAFKERLSQWVSSQGFWFQLRYSMGGGGGGSAFYHLLRMGFRLLLLLLVAGAGFWIYLLKRVETEAFPKELEASITRVLGGQETKIAAFKREGGELNLLRLAVKGGEQSFFRNLDAMHVRCRMGLLSGVTGSWNAGSLRAERLSLEIPAGADDAEAARRAGEALFRSYPKFEFSGIEVQDTSIRWGYSDRTRGAIENSRMAARFDGTAWRMQFTGGTFSQNWLNHLQILELVAVCDSSGLRFEKGEFRLGDGTVAFDRFTVSAGARPEVKGWVKLRKAPVESLLPSSLQGFVEGRISGDFKVFGSTNSGDGVGFDGHVSLENEDVVTVRDKIPLFSALRVADSANSYRKIDFRSGAFSLRTSGGALELRDVNLKSPGQVDLQGAMRARPPTREEVDASVGRGTSAIQPAFDPNGMAEAKADEGKDVTLRAAAKSANSEKKGEGRPSAEGGLFDAMNQADSERRLLSLAAENAAQSLRYEGGFRLTLPPGAFSQAPGLKSLYPADPATGRVVLEVPIEGSQENLTVKQAEMFTQKIRRDD